MYETRPERSITLYQLEDDPDEMTDLGEANAENENRLSQMIETLEARRQTAYKSGYWCMVYADTGSVADREGKVIEGEIAVEGRVTDWESRNTDDRDRVLLSGDASDRLTFRFAMDRPQDAIASTFRAVAPRKLIRFETDPPGAAVAISITVDGDPIGGEYFMVGAERTPVAGVPVSFAAGDPGLALSRKDITQKRKFEGGSAEVLFGYVAPGESATISDRLQSDLKALGYVD